jgi:hypothetical protein
MIEGAAFCPICGHRLHVDGARLLCDMHGEMKVYIDRDPLVSVVEVCDAVGIVNLEAP